MKNAISQTFMIRGATQGQFISKVALYFASKDAIYPVTLDIREVRNGIITENVLPFSRLSLNPDEVYTSSTGTVATPFIYSTPVFVQGDNEYAIVLQSSGNASNVRLHASVLGENDLNTGQKITEQPHAGILHLSSNDKTFSAEQDADLKFEIWSCIFVANSGSFTVRNSPTELMTVANTTAVIMPDEYVFGEVRLTVANTSGTFVVGNTLAGGTSSANGTITSVSGSNLRVRLNGNLSTIFNINETLASNNGATARVSTYTIPTGRVLNYVDSANASLQLYDVNTSVVFINNEWLRTTSGKNCYITSIGGNLPYDTNFTKLEDINFGATFTTYAARYTGNSFIRNSNPESFVKRTNVDHTSRKFVHSRSSEVAAMSGNASYEVVGNMYSSIFTLSPVYDKERSNFVFVNNLINNDSTGEDLAASGNALARYITRVVTLDDGQDAEDLQVILASYRPFQTDIKVYTRIINGEDSDLLTSRPWIEMVRSANDSNVFSSSENDDDFRDVSFSLPASVLTGSNASVRYTNSRNVIFTGYKYFSVKIVMLSSNPSIIPKIRDLRAIALQK